MAKPKIDTAGCIGCETCIESCPANVFALVGGVAVADALDDCVECGQCAEDCPTNAIALI